MSDRPIIFSAPMVRALLAGRKTQTRRIIKPQPPEGARYAGVHYASDEPSTWFWNTPHGGFKARERYEEGDCLWVREACGRRPASFLGIEATNGVEEAFYLADNEPVLNVHEFNLCPWWKGKASSSMLMPRLASRLTLEVTDVRVERLQDISEADAIAEGLACLSKDGGRTWKFGITDQNGRPGNDDFGWHWHEWEVDPRKAYARLWDSLHGPDAWAANPWICAIGFAVTHANIDASVPAAALPSPAMLHGAGGGS